MGLFSNLNRDGLEETRDSLGSGGAVETDAYDATIKMAYALTSKGGAQGVALTLDLGGRDYRETLWITNKKGENFYLNKNDKTKKIPLPGFVVMDDICLVTVEKDLEAVGETAEEKVVNVYDFEAKKEVPTKVPVLVELLGQQVTVGIQKTLENKTQDDGKGNYVAIADTREVNSIDKVFHTETRGTVNEVKNEQTLGEFYEKWVERNKGTTRDRREIKDGQGGTVGRPGQAAPTAAGSTAPRTSLFGKK